MKILNYLFQKIEENQMINAGVKGSATTATVDDGNGTMELGAANLFLDETVMRVADTSATEHSRGGKTRKRKSNKIKKRKSNKIKKRKSNKRKKMTLKIKNKKRKTIKNKRKY
jgi:hypothetical protein